jgi:DNA-binding FadR family transcriptional regulator
MEILQRLPGGEREISKRTVKDQIADKLAYMIVSGLLQPGDELPSERELATTLGVSRETVRGAIGVLGTRRMVEISQGSRTRIIGPAGHSLHESVLALEYLKNKGIEEVNEARTAVELQVIKLTALRITDDELARLETLLIEQKSMLRDPVSFQISDREFHSVLYGACGNTLLCDFVSDMYAYALDYRRQALKRKGAIARSVKEHELIVEALKTRDPAKAVQAMAVHLDHVHSSTMKEMAH